MDRYDFLKEQNDSEKNIKSDFNLILLTLKEIILYLVFFIPLIIGSIIFIPFNFSKSKNYFSKLIQTPIKILSNIIKWFFLAKYTAYLILFLIFMFFFQVLYLEHILNIEYYIYSFYDITQGNYLSIITSMFLHANLAHLFGNCLFLLIFGRVVEKHFGGHIIWIFFFSAIIADLISGYLSYLLLDTTKSLGASGGIAGLIIIAILLEPFTISFALLIPLPIFIIGWLAILSDIFGIFVESNTNHLAHLSGYLALIIIFFFIGIRNRQKIIKGLILNLILLIIVYLIIKIFGLELIMNLISFI